MSDEARRQNAGITQLVVQVGTIAVCLLVVVLAVVDLAQNRRISLWTVIGVFGLVIGLMMARALAIWLRIQRDRRWQGRTFGPV